MPTSSPFRADPFCGRLHHPRPTATIADSVETASTAANGHPRGPSEGP